VTVKLLQEVFATSNFLVGLCYLFFKSLIETDFNFELLEL